MTPGISMQPFSTAVSLWNSLVYLFFPVVLSNVSILYMQIGVRQVIAGWDEGILGDGKDLPPMKVRQRYRVPRMGCSMCVFYLV